MFSTIAKFARLRTLGGDAKASPLGRKRPLLAGCLFQ